MKSFNLRSPIDGAVIAERELADETHIEHTLSTAVTAQAMWRETSLVERATLCHRAIDALLSHSDAIARELTQQMGRPLQHSPGELRGLAERGRYMIDIAEEALSEVSIEHSANAMRCMRREPLGVVLTLAPWNYPYLTAVNSIIPALMAGNSLILKHSQQTALCAERFHWAFAQAGLPEGVFQYLHLDHHLAARVMRDPRIDFIAFTGSTAAGASIAREAAEAFKGLALELGGKDPAYVCDDAPMAHTVAQLVDGAFFNAGQSCCAIERIYVHRACYQAFVERFVARVKTYRLGNPLELSTSVGPMVHGRAADHVRQQIAQACQAGATTCIDPHHFGDDVPGSPYLGPQVLINVDHRMALMREESFGPVVGILPVDHDQAAIARMNDSPFGLTASIWTADQQRAESLGRHLQSGTIFMNRCDYLDPALAWSGVKQSGRGCALSSLGYHQLTRPKSFHFKSAPYVC